MGIDIDANGIEKRNSEFNEKELPPMGKNKKIQPLAAHPPDVRTGKLKQIKMQIHSGTYKISSEKIAERLIEEAMEN